MTIRRLSTHIWGQHSQFGTRSLDVYGGRERMRLQVCFELKDPVDTYMYELPHQ